MRMTGFKSINVKDPIQDRIQSGNKEQFNQLAKNPFLVGIELTTYKDPIPFSSTFGKEIPITLGASITKVPHKLGVEYQGYFIIEQDSPAIIHTYKPTNESERVEQLKDKARYIYLVASQAVTVKLWVF